MMEALAVRQTERRRNREKILSFTLIELLIIMIFVSALRYFYAERDNLSEIGGLRQRIIQLTQDLADANDTIANQRAEISELRDEVARLDQFVRRLLPDFTSTFDPAYNDVVVLEQSEFQEVLDERDDALDELEHQSDEADRLLFIIQNQQIENAELREILGAGRPKCAVTASANLLRFEFLEANKVFVFPAWSNEADGAIARSIPGVANLLAERIVDSRSLPTLLEPIQGWGLAQDPPCNLQVTTRPLHENLVMYQSQQRVIDIYFYSYKYSFDEQATYVRPDDAPQISQ